LTSASAFSGVTYAWPPRSKSTRFFLNTESSIVSPFLSLFAEFFRCQQPRELSFTVLNAIPAANLKLDAGERRGWHSPGASSQPLDKILKPRVVPNHHYAILLARQPPDQFDQLCRRSTVDDVFKLDLGFYSRRLRNGFDRGSRSCGCRTHDQFRKRSALGKRLADPRRVAFPPPGKRSVEIAKRRLIPTRLRVTQ